MRRERERECIQVNSARLQSSVLHCNFCNCNISRIYLVQRQCYVRGLIYKYYNEREESTYFKLREYNFFEVFFDFSSVRISIGFRGFHGRISCWYSLDSAVLRFGRLSFNCAFYPDYRPASCRPTPQRLLGARSSTPGRRLAFFFYTCCRWITHMRQIEFTTLVLNLPVYLYISMYSIWCRVDKSICVVQFLRVNKFCNLHITRET